MLIGIFLISDSGSRSRVDFSLAVVFVTVYRQSPKSLQFVMPMDKFSFSLDQ
jgi:hypothetical protein